MKSEEKFMGGSIRFVTAATDKLMPDGTKRTWEKCIKIVSGKKEIKVGRSFFDKIVMLSQEPEVERFMEDLE